MQNHRLTMHDWQLMDIISIDDYDTGRAKQRASVCWIVQKAHKNKVPSELHDPYYKDYENQEHLKPSIVHCLSNAEFYCSALANIYGDPNFHNFSHWHIIQALARKGVYVAEPTDVALTETVLIQTTPIKMSAHLAVIEAMMTLYIREVVIAERVVQTVQRISGLGPGQNLRTPQDQEEALVLWVDHVTQALQSRINQIHPNQDQELPVFPKIQDLSDLSDGIGLAALISYYCPQDLSWEDIAVADPPTMADSLYNIGLVIKFCYETLPYNPCLLTKEDIVYMHSSVKQNIVAFVAELFFLMELEPVSCVSAASNKKTSSKYIQLSSPGSFSGRSLSGNSVWSGSGYQRSPKIIPDLRQSISPSSTHSNVSSSASSCSGPSSSHSHSQLLRSSLSSPHSHRGSEDGGCGPFNWGSIYPPWWWSCEHKGSAEKECLYCWRHHQSQSFGDQFDYYMSSNKSSSSSSISHTKPKKSLTLAARRSFPHSSVLSDENPFAVRPSSSAPGAESLQPSTLFPNLKDEGGYHSYGDFQGISYNIPTKEWAHSSRYKGLPPPHPHQRPVSLRRGHFVPPIRGAIHGMKAAGVSNAVRRSHSMNLNDVNDARSKSENAPSSHNSDYGGRESSMSDGQDGDFVVQRAKGVCTLSDMMRNQNPNPPYSSHQEVAHDPYGSRSMAKERYNIDSKEEEMGERGRLSRRGSFHGSMGELNELPPAGMPSRLEHRPLGRSRSRRNSINAEESQLTIENFGGSQDNLNYASRNPDKEPYIHSGKRDSIHSDIPRAVRSKSVERRMDLHRPSIDEMDNRVLDKLEKEAFEREKRDLKKDIRKPEYQNLALQSETSSASDGESYEEEKPLSKATSFKELSKLKEQLPGGINIIYMQSDRDDQPSHKGHSKPTEKKTTFAALPNQTTWKQQGNQSHSHDDDKSFDGKDVTSMEPQVMSSELHNVRLQLEEKRKKIESDKRKMEMMANRERQKLGKEAFMQAVVKGARQSSISSSVPTTTSASEFESTEILADSMEQITPSLHSEASLKFISNSPLNNTSVTLPHLTNIQSLSTNTKMTTFASSAAAHPSSGFTLKDLGAEVSNVSRKWLERDGPVEELKTPDIDAMDYDEYQKSLTQMTDSLSEIQSDIQRLNHQQQQIQSMMHNGMPSQSNMPPHNQFYLHEQQGSPSRRLWNQAPEGFASMSPATRRAQWGPARPMIPQPDYMMTGHQPQQTNFYSYQMNQQIPPHQLPPISQAQGTGFMLHGQSHSLAGPHPIQGQPQSFYQNGQTYYPQEQPHQQYRPYPTPYSDNSRIANNQVTGTSFRLHEGSSDDPRLSSQSVHSSPGHQSLQRQKSPSPSPRQITHAPVAAPPPDDMAPQNVSFIESQDLTERPSRLNENDEKFKRLSISSGSRTYRISNESGSPTRPQIGTKTFRVPTKKGYHVDSKGEFEDSPRKSLSPSVSPTPDVVAEPLQEGTKAEKGFYISFDDDSGPKRPKPPLKTKRMSQRKSSTPTTPLSTPSKEEPPPIPERPPRRGHLLDKSSSASSSQLQRDSSTNSMASPSYSSPLPTFASRSDITLSPSSSTSSVPRHLMNSSSSPSSAATSYWNPPTSGLHEGSFHSGPVDGPIHSSSFEQINNYSSEDETRTAGVLNSSDIKKGRSPSAGMALVIGDELVNPDSSLSEMEKKKEKLMILSMRRKQHQEEMKRKKELEAELKREGEKVKEEEKQKKKEEDKARREMILERHKIKKAIEEAEKEGRHYTPPAWYYDDSSGSATPTSKFGSGTVRLRPKGPSGSKPRPKTMHEASFGEGGSSDIRRLGSRGSKSSSQNLHSDSASPGSSYLRKNQGRWGSTSSLSRATGSRGSTGSLGSDYSGRGYNRTSELIHSGKRPNSVMSTTSERSSLLNRERSKPSLYGSRGRELNSERGLYQVHEARRPSALVMGEGGPSGAYDSRRRSSSYTRSSPRKYRSTGNLYGQNDHDTFLYHVSEDSGLGRATPPRRAPSPGMSSRHLPSPSGPESLPPGLFSRRRPGGVHGGGFDDNASDISVSSSNMDYCGPRLFKQPAAKSNRPIVLNAVEYCVFPGVVNQNAKQRVLEEIARSESKHFLILFRDSGCQFRAIYSFNPDTEEVYKLYGTGPKQVTDRMFDKFFKYNSGGKCFSQIHTKHLTVTIDAFTIHNSLWQGKRVNLPSKKDMKLVI